MNIQQNSVVAFILSIVLAANDVAGQSGSVTPGSGSITCAPPGNKAVSWSGTCTDTSGYDVVACYAPVYADENNETESPSTYYDPPSSSGGVYPYSPGSTGSSVSVQVSQTITEPGGTMYLTGVYVWFEWGNWYYNFPYGPWYWQTAGGTDWCWIPNPGGSCFASGTPLLTPDGAKPIEQLKAGDWILSAAPNDAPVRTVPRHVKEVIRTRGKLLDITVRGQVVQATREHPFYVKGEGWTPAASLSIGDLLRSHNDQWLPVESIVKANESHVYNVAVEENGTFFVGDRDWGFSLWVYGACNGPATSTKSRKIDSARTNMQNIGRTIASWILSNSIVWDSGD